MSLETKNLSLSQPIDPALLEEVAQVLSRRFDTPIQIESAVTLSDPTRRNLIGRIKLQNPPQGCPESLILKQSLRETSENDQEIFDRFARDWAGLEFSNEFKTKIPLTPKFYAGSLKFRFILMEDLGEVHTSLVDSLTGQSKTEALSALTRYMQVLAQLHGLGSKHVKNYTTKLQALTPTPLPWLESAEETHSKALRILKKFKIPVTACFENEITSVFSVVKDPGPFTTLIHGDICPDNVFDDSMYNDMRIIDFEWGFVGNALLDAVYLRMCMPTCWCAKVFPEEVIDVFDPLYRKELMKHLPAASCDDLYYESYAAACAYWMIGRISNLEDILEKDNDLSDPKYANLHPNWKPEDNQQRPRTLYRLQAFILVSEKYDLFPLLRAIAQAVLKKLKRLWKDTEPLEVYRAFQ